MITKRRSPTETKEWCRRADLIGKIVLEEYDVEDGADLALDEMSFDPDRSDREIARAVAQRVLQP